MCFYGSEGMGLRADNLKVHVMVAAWEWGAYLGQEALENGIRIRKSTFVKNDSHPSMYLAKANGNYINSMLALDEAMARVMMKRCYSIARVMSPKAAVKISLWSRTACYIRRHWWLR